MNESSGNPPDPNLDALFAQARTRRPDTSAAEFAFETRLLARIREQRDSQSIWATVSWRMIPFFTACVLGLAIWQAETTSSTSDAVTIAGLTNPVAADVWND